MANGIEKTRTDDLIEALAAAQRPQPRRPPSLAIVVGGAIGLALALVLTCAILGIRPGFVDSWVKPVVWLKFGVTGLIFVSASIAARQLSLPGRDWRGTRAMLSIIFFLIVAWAGADLIARPLAEWVPCLEGRDWSTCLMAIPLLSLTPMLVMGIAMRRLAPTRLRTAGALLGLAAGAVAAMAFSLYCRDDAVAFVAVWYGAALAVSTLIGRTVGPWLLRW